MGQKINPIGLRLGINRGWDSTWFAKKKDFGKYLIEDFKIRNYIKKNIINSGVSEIIIERSSKKCTVSIHTSRPGFVIGKKGSDIDKIKNNLSKLTINEVNLNIKEVKKPETNAYLVAENIAQQLVKRISYRRAMKRAMQSCIRLGAKGIKVSVSGRLGGNEIARTEWLRDGSIPSHTLRADIDYAEAEALTTYGIIGIKVWIYKGEVFAREFSQETNKVTPKESK
jgi:small subunit ribosomal protein S3